jgi:transposase
MFRKIGRDVKIAAIRLYERELLSLDNILDCCGFSERTWYRILKLWRETGDVINPNRSLRGRLRSLDHDDLAYLLRLIRQNPDYFLDELLYLLKTNRFISVNYVTIHRELERAGVSCKKLKRIAKERNEGRRADFIGRMAQYSPEELGFLDETSKDERTVGRRYGRCMKGQRAERKQVFVRGRRTSTEALLTLDGVVAGTVVEGSMTKAMFLEYLEFNVASIFIVFIIMPKLTVFNSFRSAQHILALSVFSSWIMPRFTMATKFLSFLIVSVSLLCMVILSE